MLSLNEHDEPQRRLWESYLTTRDATARNALVEAHMRLVHWYVNRQAHRMPSHVDPGDLVAVGSIGLIKAVERFDPGRGCAFVTLAVECIKGEILHYLRDHVKRHAIRKVDIPEDMDIWDHVADARAEEQLAAVDRRAVLEGAIGHLSGRCGDVAAGYLRTSSIPDTARATGLAPQTTRNNFNKAKHRLWWLLSDARRDGDL